MYYFFLHGVPLPVTPSALEITTPSKNTTVTLINDGEINIPKEQGLREISFDFLLPQTDTYPFANFALGAFTASAFIPVLNLAKQLKTPIQFIVTRLTPDNKPRYFTNIKVLIEDFTYKEDAEEYGMDTLCTIRLKEYKDYGTSVTLLSKLGDAAINAAVGVGATAVVATVTKTRESTSKVSPKQYIVKKGDTLWNICKKELGDGSKYKEIAELNKLENPNKIYVGQKLRLG